MMRLNTILALGAAMILGGSLTAWPAEGGGGIDWIHDLEEAQKIAAEQNKYILLDVYAEWCGPCQMMKKNTWTDGKVIEAIQKSFVPLQIDSDKDPQTSMEYGVESLPTVMVLTAKGTPISQKLGYQGPDSLISFLNDALERTERLKSLRQEVEKNPDDLEKVVELAKLQLTLDETQESIDLLSKYRDRIKDEAPADLQARYAYQLGLAYLMNEQYPKGLELLESFLTANKEHQLADIATQMYGLGTVEYAKAQVAQGESAQARQTLEALGDHPEQPELSQLSEQVLAMLDSYEAEQAAGAEAAPETAPSE